MHAHQLVLAALIGCTLATCRPSTSTNDSSDTENVNTDNTPDGCTTAIVADHSATAEFDTLPAPVVKAAASTFRIWYGHTSHGSQILTGMQMLAAGDDRYAYNAGAGTLTLQHRDDVDLGQGGSLDWVDTTRSVLNQPGQTFNIVMWSWCGGVSDSTQADIAAYLNAMHQLETDYPDIVFVYMTGHLDGTGPTENLCLRNNQIRTYCQTNNKVLFDFADIESYDPAGTYDPDGSDACEWCTNWCATHPCPTCEECAHSHCFNCYQKGRAFWWMMGRLTGWNGS